MNGKKIDYSVFSDFLNGDEKAFSIIFNQYSLDVLKRVKYVVKDEDVAVDIMQQLFVKLWVNRESLTVSYELFDAYINRMITSLSIDHLRRSVRVQNLINTLSNNTITSQETTEDEYIYKESLHIIEEAINTLSPQRRQIFTLCRLEGKSYKEVSEILGISVSTVSNQLVSANKNIRSYASKYNLEIKILLAFLIF